MDDSLDLEPKKMCIFCHAQVSVEAKICPFCRANFDQIQTKTQFKTVEANRNTLSEKETLDSLYPPPYQPKMQDIEEEEPCKKEEEKTPIEKTAKKSSVMLPIFLFSIGAQLLVFSVFLLVFSEGGMLFLRWKSSLWFLYSLVAIVFLYTGYFLFQKDDEAKG